MTDKVKCCKSVYSKHLNFARGHQCTKTATTEHEGKPYCKTHNPALRKAKADASYQAWKSGNDAKYTKQKADANKIAVHDALVAALRLFVDPFDGDTIHEISDDYGLGTAKKIESARAALELAKD